MNGVVADEAGRSINGTGSRSTGATPCLKRLGVAVKVDGGQLPKRRRIGQKRPPESSANNSSCGSQPADIPRTRRRNLKPDAKPQKQRPARKATANIATKCKAKPKKVAPAAAPRKKGSVQLGLHQWKKGKSVCILQKMLQAARSHKVTAADPLVRATEYANFLSSLPSGLGLGDYTCKHILRKHLLQHIGTEGATKAGQSREVDTPRAGLAQITMSRLLQIFPDVGQHLSDVDSGLPPAKLAKVLGCPTVYLTMWPCLLNEALQHRPQNAELLWGKSVAEIGGALRRYRAQWGINPSPRVLLSEVAKMSRKTSDAEPSK